MNRALCLLIIVATSLAYAGSFRAEFILDDFDSIVRNGDIHSLQWEAIRTTYGPTRAVVATTVAANYWFGGIDPVGYHLINLLVHVAAALTLFGIVWRLLRGTGWGNSSERIAFVAALIFAVHPLQTSAVTYVIQRMESMTSLFYLLTAYTLVRAAQSRRAAWWSLASVLFYFLAIFSKEVALTAPAVALLLDRAFLARSWGAIWEHRRWLYIAYAIPLLIFFVTLSPKLHLLQSDYGEQVILGIDPDKLESKQAAENRPANLHPIRSELIEEAASIDMPSIVAATGPTLNQFVRSQPVVILHYFRLAILPVGQCFDYQWQPETSWLRIGLASAVILSMIGVSAFVLMLPGKADRRHQLAFAVLSIFVMLSPRSTLQVLDLAVEYRMYLPMAVGTTLMAVGLAVVVNRLIAKKNRNIAFALLAAMLCLFFARQTIARNELFASRLRMWEDVVATSPLNARARLNYATALAASGRQAESLEQTQIAVDRFSQPAIQQTDPAEAYRLLGDRLLDAGRDDESRRAYLIVLNLDRSNTSVYPGLAELTLRAGEPERAGTIFRATR